MHLIFLYPTIRHEPRIWLPRVASWLSWIKQSAHMVLAMALILFSFLGFPQPAYLTALACDLKKVHPISKIESYLLNKKSLEHPPPIILSLFAKDDKDILFSSGNEHCPYSGEYGNASVVWLLEKDKRMDFGSLALDLNLPACLSVSLRFQATY